MEQTAWKRSLRHYDPFAPVTAWDLGRVSEAASAADDAIFHVLATARANCHVKMTDAQLFGPDPLHELAQGDGQAHLGPEPVDVPAAEGEPASAEQDQAIEAEPPTPQHGPTDVARPRRPIHAV